MRKTPAGGKAILWLVADLVLRVAAEAIPEIRRYLTRRDDNRS